jgi:exo-beta-1,3-glucanase (GH17 family)
MKFVSPAFLSPFAAKLSRLIGLACVAGLIASCGGGGFTSTTADPTAVFITNPRALPAEYKSRKAVSYSPYRTSDRETEVITAAMVKQDLDLLVKGNFRLIRLFDSSDKVAKLVLDVIVDHGLDIKVQLGAYVFPTKYKNQPGWVTEPNPYKVEANEALNQAELNRTIALATNAKYKNLILAVSIGNETLVNWTSVPQDAEKLAQYIKKVRDAITQPVTTDDNFLAFRNPAPKPVVNQIDFVAIHMYPNIDTEYPESEFYWDWKQTSVPAGPARAKAMMDASMVELRRQYAMVRTAVNSMGLFDMPIAITETGWKAFDSEAPKQVMRAHPVNQKMFYERMDTFRVEGRTGVGPANIFYFEAFDEPWKKGDNGWGLFDVNRKARYVIASLYDATERANNLVTDANAVYFDPPVAQAAVSATNYTLFSDVPGATSVSSLRIDAYEGDSVVRNPSHTDVQANQGVNSMLLTPSPKSWGWGQLWQPEPRLDHETPPSYSRNENLSAFSGGNINVWVKTTYPGKIQIGLSTLTENGESTQVLLPIASGEYGYKNDGTWNLVQIPLQVFQTKQPKLDLRFVVSPFHIADIYADTGKAENSKITTPIAIDSVHWSR